jgi:phosphoglycerol transferase MdoB-like AlkP superfamily enzyme
LNKEFKIIPEDQNIKNEISKYGFESMAQFNAMRLQDHSLGKFISEAKKSAWYDNTIFIIFGDHGLPHNNAANVSDWEKTQANGYHVPLIIHSPRYIKKGIENKIASEMDIMPTAAGLIGIKYQTRSFGKDLFNKDLDQNRFAFSYNWYPPHHLSLIDGNFYFEKIPYNNNTLLFNYNKSGATNIKESELKKHYELNALSEGLYETAKYLLYHNPKTY